MSQPELVDLVKKLRAKRKYGIVWEEEKTKEHLEFNPITSLPLISESIKMNIHTNDSNLNHCLIEGDNYYALSILRYTHENKIDLIYIDPPYNTGNSEEEEGFVYNDKRVDADDTYRHSKWLSFMHKRLLLAKDLMSDTGFIFISIDENEFAQLRLLCDRIFGERNFINYFVWKKRSTGGQVKDGSIITQTEFIFAYAKNKNLAKLNKLENLNSGATKWRDLRKSGGQWQRQYRPKQYFPFFYNETKDSLSLERSSETDIEVYPQDSNGVDGFWENGFETASTRLANNEYRAEKIAKGSQKGIYKIKQLEVAGDEQNVGNFIDIPSVQGANEIKKLGLKFNNAKPLALIEHLLKIGSKPNSIILDFFAGSGTTGHAVLNLNIETNSRRQFILITNNENNIHDEVTYPRLSKVIKGYQDSSGRDVKGISANLNCFKVWFLAKSQNSDEMKIRLTENISDILRLKEATYTPIETENLDNKIFGDKNKVLAIYNSFDPSNLDELRLTLDKFGAKRNKLYVFTFDKEGLNAEYFSEWKHTDVEPIPQGLINILENFNDN